MALTLEYAFTIAADLGEIREVGKTHAGVRRVIPIVGGTVTDLGTWPVRCCSSRAMIC